MKGRKPKYNFSELEVGKGSIVGSYTIVSCAINWAKKNGFDWKFKSERLSNTEVKVWRIK